MSTATGYVQQAVHALPAVGWLSGYQRAWLRGDLVAALTLWTLVVPQSIAYAQIGGLPPEAGLFATFGGLLGYGLLGTSRQLVVSPTSATAAISAALVGPVAAGDPDRFLALSAALAAIFGLVMVVFGLFSLGFVSRFIAASVQAGLMFGLGLTIIAGQVPKLLGIPPVEGDFFDELDGIISGLGDIHGWTVAIGLSGLAAMFGLRRVAPAVPAGLVVVVVSIAAVSVFDLSDQGVAVIGDLDATLPSLAIPSLSWSDFEALLPGTLAIALIGYAESAAVAESLADKHRYTVKPDQEMRALGGASLLAGLFQGFIVAGGASQSAANDEAGARTQLSGLLVAALTLLTAAVLLPLFQDLPQAALAAIVINAVWGFLNVAGLRRIGKLRRDSLLLALFTMGAVLVLGILLGLMVAIAISVLLVLGRLARPSGSQLGRESGSDALQPIGTSGATQPLPGAVIYRLDLMMMFTNAKLVRDEARALVAALPGTRTVILDLTFSPSVDIETVDVIESLQRELQSQGVELWLANVHAGARMVLTSAAVTDGGGPRLFRRIEEAVDALDVRPGDATAGGTP